MHFLKSLSKSYLFTAKEMQLEVSFCRSQNYLLLELLYKAEINFLFGVGNQPNIFNATQVMFCLRNQPFFFLHNLSGHMFAISFELLLQ